MMTFVSAGLALGLAGAAHIASSREPGVVGRPLAGKSPMLTTICCAATPSRRRR